jgi:hypothetical protein
MRNGSAKRNSMPENSMPEAPDAQVPWFEQVLGTEKRGLFALGDVSAGWPWWVEAFVEPLGFLVLPGFLYVMGSVPEGIGGTLAIAGFISLAFGSSFAALARRARNDRGPTSRPYWRLGSGAILLLGAGLASLLVGTALVVVSI